MAEAGFRDAITTYGDPANPPIVFLHGIRLGGGIWQPHGLQLRDEFYVVAPDLPGHGALAHLPFDPPSIDALLAYIADKVVSRPPLLVGYSLGGYVAMRYACDMRNHTSGLVLTGSSTNIVGVRRTLYDAAVRITGLVSDASIQALLAAFFHVTLPKHVADVVIPFPFNHRVFKQSLEIAGGIHYSDMLRTYGKPVMLVNGRWDVLFRRDEQRYAQAASARVVVLPRADHVAPLRLPEQFSETVRGFARTVFGTLGIRPEGQTA